MHEGKSLQYTGVWFIALLLLPEKGTKTKGRGGGGGGETSYDGLYVEVPPKTGTFFYASGKWHGTDFTR